MNRYVYTAIAALVFALPQAASAESVSFGASLDNDGGHVGGSASGNGIVTGQIHWHGTSIDVESGWVTGFNGWLEGTVKRSRDSSLKDQAVTVYVNSDSNYVLLSIPALNKFYQGFGHVTIK